MRHLTLLVFLAVILCAANLPAQTTPLIGRTAELDALQALLADDEIRLVTLTGPGGSGKSAVL